MDVDEISLEQLKPTACLDSLKWNRHDNIMAAFSDNSVYFLSLRPNGTQSRFVLNIPGPKLVRICWSNSLFPFEMPWGQIQRMVLFVLSCEGRLQAWAETSSSMLNRWELRSEIKVGGTPLSIDSFEGNIYVGDSSGNIHLLKFKDGKLGLVQTKLFCKDEPVTKISASEKKLAFAHGPRKVSYHDFAKKKTECLIEDTCIGTTFLSWAGENLLAIKYNQLFQVLPSGNVSRKEIVSPDIEPEGFCSACLSPDNSSLWLASFEGNIYKYIIESGTLIALYQQDKSASSRTLGFCASSSGRSLSWLSVDKNLSVKIMIADSGFSGSALPENDTGIWEAGRYNVESCSEFARLKLDLFSSETSKKVAAIQALSLQASKKLSSDEKHGSAWSSFLQYLENPTSKWAALKNFSPEICPDCGESQVLFESFTEAKCHSGHVLSRCSGSFACLGTDDPFEECEGCCKRFKIGLFNDCPYCSGRLFHVS